MLELLEKRTEKIQKTIEEESKTQKSQSNQVYENQEIA